MTEQQYTCPFCHNDYTRYTIADHYGCGVEPLETIEDIKQELDSISEEVAEQESTPFTTDVGAELLEMVEQAYHPHEITLTAPPVDLQELGFSPPTELTGQENARLTDAEIESAIAQQVPALKINKIEKPVPKKRGRPAKAKVA